MLNVIKREKNHRSNYSMNISIPISFSDWVGKDKTQFKAAKEMKKPHFIHAAKIVRTQNKYNRTMAVPKNSSEIRL